MKLKFKNRIAFFNTIAAATSTFLVFWVVYSVVSVTAYKHLDDDIRKEKADVFESLHCVGDSIILHISSEWSEKEHEQVEVNPTFLQITDKNGSLVFQSANLKKDHLSFKKALEEAFYFDNEFKGKSIRQGQFPIRNDEGEIVGQLSVGTSLVESAVILHNLLITLLIAFPLLTLIFYWASSFAASRGIAPIHQLIETAQRINGQTIETRLPLPARQDEIYFLASTINELLNRIENSLKREKQITADISHEIRSPLTGIRGTIEVLLRKQRAPEQYIQKMELVLQETDRLNKILEQLLQLSRIEAGAVQPNKEPIDGSKFLHALVDKWQLQLKERRMTVKLKIPLGVTIIADAALLDLIVSNLLSNALKYGNPGGKIDIVWDAARNCLSLNDDGPGIPVEHLPFIFDRFYRADTSRNIKTPGTGLGLSITQKLADLQGIRLEVQSQAGLGTSFVLHFPPEF